MQEQDKNLNRVPCLEIISRRKSALLAYRVVQPSVRPSVRHCVRRSVRQRRPNWRGRDGSGAIAVVRRAVCRSRVTKATGSRHWARRGPSSRPDNARSVAPIKALGLTLERLPGRRERPPVSILRRASCRRRRRRPPHRSTVLVFSSVGWAYLRADYVIPPGQLGKYFDHRPGLSHLIN